jgi:hypothetical protein
VVGNKNLYIPSLTVCVERFAMWFSFGVDSSKNQILERTYTKKGCVLPAHNHLFFQAFFLDGLKPEAIPGLITIMSIQKHLCNHAGYLLLNKMQKLTGFFPDPTSISCSTKVYCFLCILMCIYLNPITSTCTQLTKYPMMFKK